MSTAHQHAVALVTAMTWQPTDGPLFARLLDEALTEVPAAELVAATVGCAVGFAAAAETTASAVMNSPELLTAALSVVGSGRRVSVDRLGLTRRRMLKLAGEMAVKLDRPD